MARTGRHPRRRLSVAPPLNPAAYLRRPRRPLPFPLEESGHRLYARARHGLYHGLRALGLAPGDEALVPAYNHGSEVEALARAGVRCRFYDCDGSLAPDAAQVEALRGPRTRVLYLIHYYGFPQDLTRWRAWCDERGLLLVEDAAQAWLSWWKGAPVGSFGDLAIFCLHKSFGLPDGGALIARHPPPPVPPPPKRRLGGRQLARRHREWLAQRSARAARTGPPGPAAEIRREVPSRAFALGDPDTHPSTMTTFLLPRMAAAEAAATRRANFERLCERLGEAVPEAFRGATAGAAPYVCLVAVPRKHALIEHLAAHEIVGGLLWETPHPLLPVEDFPVSARLRSTLVGLPVHHELAPEDLDRIADVFARWAGGRS